MELPNELIYQFAKMIKNEKDREKESTVYGTIVERNDIKYVRLDGADENVLTPVNTTADFKADDRVAVLIKNHTATVMGNTTDPSASSSDVKDIAKAAEKVKEFDAQIARIDDLEVSNKAMTTKLETISAQIENIEYEPKILWGDDLTSGMYMTEGHTITLKEAVSAQRHGIVLVFCAYNGTDDTNYSWQSFFVPKQLVALSTSGHTFVLGRGKFTYTGTKYLYIKDTSIVGHADNNLTGSNNGITYANNKFVLRYVIGV